jgi:hypothetical protein
MNRSRIKAQFNEHFQARYEAYIYYCSLALATQMHLSVSPYYLLEKVEMLVGIRYCCSQKMQALFFCVSTTIALCMFGEAFQIAFLEFNFLELQCG